MKKSAVILDSVVSVGDGVINDDVVVAAAVVPNAVFHSVLNSLLDVAAGVLVLRISFSNVMSSLSTSKSVDSRSTTPVSNTSHLSVSQRLAVKPQPAQKKLNA